MSQLPKPQLEQLRGFVEILKHKQEILHEPCMSFFREYLVSLGATIPDPPTKEEVKTEPKSSPQKENVSPNMPEPMEQDIKEEEEVESDIELDMTGVIEPDNEDPQEMGNCYEQGSVELSDEQMEKLSEKRSEAIAAFSEREWEKSIDLFTDCVKIDSSSAMVYTKRGTCFLKLNRPNASIRDLNRAIELNPDSAPALKFRGRAHGLLGHFVEAATDLRTACKLDFDEVADEWLKEVTPNAKKIEEHERKKQRRNQEREVEEKKEKIKKAREAREKAAKERPANGKEMPEGMSGMGDLGGLFQDPELFAALQDPEVATAFQEISSNPANLSKYQGNPKIMALLTKMMGKFPGASSSSSMPGMHGMKDAFMKDATGGMPGKCPAGFSASEEVSNGESKTAQPNGTTTDDLD